MSQPTPEQISKIQDAWNIPGKMPEYHRVMKAKLQEEWPRLYYALAGLAKDRLVITSDNKLAALGQALLDAEGAFLAFLDDDGNAFFWCGCGDGVSLDSETWKRYGCCANCATGRDLKAIE